MMNRGDDLSSLGNQKIQSAEYQFPYHYIPQIGQKIFFSRHWGFAPSYVAALELVTEKLLPLAKTKGTAYRHIDIGCGDGSLIHFLLRLPEFRPGYFLGIDSDQRAISWARMFNPSVEFFVGDISEIEEKYDSCTLIEVLEHISPNVLPNFIESAAQALRPDGLMVITVPSIEKRIIEKHFQHFSFESMRELIEVYFDEIQIFGFEKHTFVSRLAVRGLRNTICRLDVPRVNRIVVDQLRRLHVRQKGCGRLFVTCRRRTESPPDKFPLRPGDLT